MMAIIDIEKFKKGKPSLEIVRMDEDSEYDKLMAAMSSAMNSLKASRQWPEFKKAHLLNCKDAVERVSYYLNDEIDDAIGSDQD